MKKKSLALIVLALLALSFSGSAYAKDVIKIGLTVSTSGKYTFASSQGFKGVSIWADQVNKTAASPLTGKSCR